MTPRFHTYQSVTFRGSVFHMSAASAMFFLKPKFLDIKTGELYEFLASKLVNSPRFSSSKVNFTLVNVFSRPSGFSRGVSEPPPNEVCPANKHLLFTFAYDIHDDPNKLDLTVKNKRSNSVSQFGNKHSQSAFTTIGLTSNECAKFGCNALYTQQLAYLYNILGVMTKSLAKYSSFYDYASYESHYTKGLKYLKENVGSRNLHRVLTSTPYALWVFNPLVWRYAPNLLTVKMVTPLVALYYFAELHSEALRNLSLPAIKRLVGFPEVPKDSVLDHLSVSLLNFVHSVQSEDSTFETPLDVLAPSVIDSLVATGQPTIELSYSTENALWKQLEKRAAFLVQAFADREENLGKLFMPHRQASIKMFSANDAYTSRLVQDLEF